MSLRSLVFSGFLFVLVAAVSAQAALLDLYSDEDWQLFGAGANGQYRAQHFSPTESTPNALSEPFFDSAAFRISLSDPSEALTDSTLKLFAWNGSHNATVAGVPIATAPVNLYGPFDGWISVSFAPQSASGQYLLALQVGSVWGQDFGIRKSTANDGGPNNNAYNNNDTIRTDREYQVRLNAVPEPAAILLLAVGMGLTYRRRV